MRALLRLLRSMSKKIEEDNPEIVGPCCACGKMRALRNILTLPRRGAPGHGWGCVICKLPADGAVAALCDDCFDLGIKLKFVCAGYAKDPARIALADLPPEPFKHDPNIDHEADCVMLAFPPTRKSKGGI